MDNGASIASAACWYILSLAFLLFPPPLGAALLIALASGFVWRRMLRPGVRQASSGDIGLRAIGPNMSWVAAATLTFVIFDLAFVLAYVRILPHPTASWDYWENYRRRPWGQIAPALAITVIGPLIEEYICRGVVQHALVRRLGPVRGIVLASLIFGALHLRVWPMPDLFLFGLAAGVLVYRARSIWAGVMLHTTTNAVLLLLASKKDAGVLLAEGGPVPLWGFAVVAIVAALVFVGIAAHIRSTPSLPPARLHSMNGGLSADARTATLP